MRGTTEKWVTAWGNAVSIRTRRPENYGKDLTLRYPVKMMLDGTAVRITLDNFCGNEDVTVSCAYIADSDGSENLTGVSVPITFDGNESVTIPAGRSVVSDEISFPVSRGKYASVSLYFADFTELRSAVAISGSLSSGYFAVGNYAAAEKLPDDLSKPINVFYFLCGIDVLTDSTARTVICYGDSITAQAWPDYLAQTVLDNGIDNTAVIRRAASGTRILRQYDNITYDSYGLKGDIRFPREIIAEGADTVIIQHGINDIIHPVGTDVNKFRPWSDLPTVDELIEGVRMYIRIAREHGMKVYLGTLLPIKGWRTYADFRDDLRNEFNNWMRTTDEADGCIDFDAAVRDENDPAAFAQGFDSGDHLHPSNAAYKRMAEEAAKVLFGI